MIIQGSNLPIIINFSKFVEDATNIVNFNCGLFGENGNLIKEWVLEEVYLSGTNVILPLKQSETRSISDRVVYLEFKVKKIDDNSVYMNDTSKIGITKKFYQEIIGEDLPQITDEYGYVILPSLSPAYELPEPEPEPPVPETPYAKMSFGILKGNTDDIVFSNQDKIELEIVDNKDSSFEVSVRALEVLDTFDSTTPSQVGDVPYSWFGLVLGDFITVDDVSKDVAGLIYNGSYTLTEADATEANAVLPDEFIDKQNKFFALWLANDKPESMTENKRTINISDGIDVVTINITFIPFV